MKDVGGLVADYQRQTEIYRREGREVRLHECRSACTMALSLPNVCVYPTSVLRFHQAYNRDTKQVDHGISAELFATYPEPIRRRLGYLTRHYRSLRGSELIELGVRSCNETPVMFAQRMQRKTGGTQIASAAPASAGAQEPGTFSRLAGTLTAMLSGRADPAPAAVGRPSPLPTLVARAEAAGVPLPPVRPADLADPTPTASVPDVTEEGHALLSPPLPPERPAHLGPSIQIASEIRRPANAHPYGELPRMITGSITGSWPVLPPAFSAYAPLR